MYIFDQEWSYFTCLKLKNDFLKIRFGYVSFGMQQCGLKQWNIQRMNWFINNLENKWKRG